jgi:hypothetical protein
MSQAQFLLADVPPLRNRKPGTKGYWFTYQSGLFYTAGKLLGQAKPAAYSYAMPFRASAAGIDPGTETPFYNIWGQLRFLPNGTADVAHVQWRPKDGSLDWADVGDPVAIDERGYYTTTRTAPLAAPGEWRAAWLRPDGSIGSTSPGSDGS